MAQSAAPHKPMEDIHYQLPLFVRKLPTLADQINHYREVVCSPDLAIPFDSSGARFEQTLKCFQSMSHEALVRFASQVHVMFEQMSLLPEAQNKGETPRIHFTGAGYNNSGRSLGSWRGGAGGGNARVVSHEDLTLGADRTALDAHTWSNETQSDVHISVVEDVGSDRLTSGTLHSDRTSNTGLLGTVDRGGRNSITSVMSFVLRDFTQVKMTGKVSKGLDDEGYKIINQFVILREIGRGTFGKVKLAYDSEKNNQVAIKIVKRNAKSEAFTTAVAQGSPLARARRNQFEREINVMKLARHRNIVRLHEVIDDPQSHKLYMVMQYVDRGSVSKLKPDHTYDVVPPDTLLMYAKQMMSGLAYLHENGIYHLDIKPENCLLNSDGEVFLSDFGISENFRTMAVPTAECEDDDEPRPEDGEVDGAAASRTSMYSNSPWGSAHSIMKQPAGGGGPSPSASTSGGNAGVVAGSSGTTTVVPGGVGAFAAVCRDRDRPLPRSPLQSSGPSFHPVGANTPAQQGDSTATNVFLADIEERNDHNDEDDDAPKLRRPGTVPFLSPQMLDGSMHRIADVKEQERVLAANDIFACGVTWFALLTGRLPFATTQEAVQCDSLDLSKVGGIPAEWASILKSILTYDYKCRPAAEELKKKFKSTLASKQRSKRRVTVVEHAAEVTTASHATAFEGMTVVIPPAVTPIVKSSVVRVARSGASRRTSASVAGGVGGGSVGGQWLGGSLYSGTSTPRHTAPNGASGSSTTYMRAAFSGVSTGSSVSMDDRDEANVGTKIGLRNFTVALSGGGGASVPSQSESTSTSLSLTSNTTAQMQSGRR